MRFLFSHWPALNSERSRFQELYKTTVRPLGSHLRSLGLHDVQDLEDVLQNTYLEAHKSFHTLRDQQAALAWLMTIGRRQYHLHLSRKIRHRQYLSAQDQGSLEAGGQLVDRKIKPADDALHNLSLCQPVVRKIDAIADPKRQAAVRMFFLEDRSLKEIAGLTTTNISTLTTWISRFRKDVAPLLRSEQQPTACEGEDAFLAVQEVFP